MQQKMMRSLPSSAVALMLVLGLMATAPAWTADWAYTVRPGDNLWNITERYLTNIGYVSRLQKYNGIADPYHVPPGTRIRIPIDWSVIRPAPAIAAQVAGEVSLRDAADADPRPLEAGAELSVGNEISTGDDGSVLIRFADSGELALKANSVLKLDTMSAFGDTGMVDSRVRVIKGRAELGVKRKQEGDSYYEVTTPAAVTAVRGTQFRISADTDMHLSRTEVTDGKVSVTGAGKTRYVPANYGVVVEDGKAPIPPVRLLSAPDLSSLPSRIEQVAFALEWPSVNGAASYRVQVATSESFDTTLLERLSERPRIGLSSLPDGDYHLRARAIDKRTLEGLDSAAAFTLDARPEPPIILGPLPDDIVRVREPVMTWAKTEDTRSYRLQVARDPAFTDLVANVGETKATKFAAGPMDDGDYFWRIGLTDSSGDQGPYSPPIAFKVQPPPPSPNPGPPQVEDQNMVFSWPGIEGFSYVFQLARDSAFENILVDRTVDEPRISMPRLLGGRYFLRMATIDETGYRSPFGPSANVDVPLFR